MSCPHYIWHEGGLFRSGWSSCNFWTKNTGQEKLDQSHFDNYCYTNDVNNKNKCPYFFLRNFDIK